MLYDAHRTAPHYSRMLINPQYRPIFPKKKIIKKRNLLKSRSLPERLMIPVHTTSNIAQPSRNEYHNSVELAHIYTTKTATSDSTACVASSLR